MYGKYTSILSETLLHGVVKAMAASLVILLLFLLVSTTLLNQCSSSERGVMLVRSQGREIQCVMQCSYMFVTYICHSKRNKTHKAVFHCLVLFHELSEPFYDEI